MNESLINLIYLAASVLFILGLKGLAHPRTAVRGNLMGATGMLIAVIVTLLNEGITDWVTVLISMVIGSAISTSAVVWSVFRLSSEPNYLVDFMPTVAGFGLGWGLSNPSMNSWALAAAPQAFFGEVNASFNTIRNLAAAIGTAGGIAIIGASSRPDALAAYERANIFFASWVGLSFVTVAIGTWLLSRPTAP